jgi:hypothetical protein
MVSGEPHHRKDKVMSNASNAPTNIEDAIFHNLQQDLLPAKLNPDIPHNLKILLRWASEEHYQKKSFPLDAAPQVIAGILLERVKASPKSLIWDVEPDFAPPAAPPLTREEVQAELQRKQREFEAKETKRILKEQLENATDNLGERSKQAETEKKAAAEKKSEAIAQTELDNAITRVTVNRGPGRIDYGKSDAVRTALRQIVVKVDGVVNYRETLKAVTQIINRLPDDASGAANVEKIKAEINREREAAASAPRRRDSLGSY